MKDHARYEVSVKIILRKENKLLILIDNDNFWDFPGGRVSSSETQVPFLDIIKREIKEELGEDITYRMGGPAMVFTRHLEEQEEPVLIVAFEAKYKKGDIKLSKEHKSYKWINLNEKLLRSSFYSNDEYLSFLDYLKNNNIVL